VHATMLMEIKDDKLGDDRPRADDLLDADVDEA
jgi:hypothetical protein